MNMTTYQLSGKCVAPEEWKAGIGHDFRHYKGKMYRLVGLWMRPAKMVFEDIEVGGRRIRRFERV